MNAARQRPDHQHTDKTDSNMADGGYRWFSGRGRNDTRQNRRIQFSGVATDGRQDQAGGGPDSRAYHARISCTSVRKKMRRKIIGWINDPNVLLPVLAFCVVMLTTIMARAGVI